MERLDDSVLNAIHWTKWVRPTSTVSSVDANKTFQICTRWKRTQGVYMNSGSLEISLTDLMMFLIIAVEHCSFQLTCFSPRQHYRKGKPSGKPKCPRDFTDNFKKGFENIRMQQSICNCRRNWCQPGQEITFRLLRQGKWIFFFAQKTLIIFYFFFWKANSLLKENKIHKEKSA